jgi:hypothetical protein
MKIIQLLLRVEVTDKTSPQRVQKLTDTLLDIGLADAAETLHNGEGNLKDAKAVANWNFHAPKIIESCATCHKHGTTLVKVKGAVEGGPWVCECDNTHTANNTVCRYCWDVLGRRKPGDTMLDRIVAQFQPQVVVNDNYLDIGPAVPVDVTEAVLEIGEKAARAIEDDDYPADDLMPSSIFDWNKTKHGTDAACRVTVAKAIREYYEKHPTHT